MADKTEAYSRMAATRAEVYKAIDTERDYQDFTWPAAQTVGEHILLLEEYVARARHAWSGETNPEVAALEMIRKVAGIAVNAMEQHGASKREFYKP